MTATLVALYVAAGLFELAGVMLVVIEVRSVYDRYTSYQEDIAGEQAALSADPMFALDPMTLRYGFTPARVLRSIAAVDELFTYRHRQLISVGLIVVGLIFGLIGNLLSVLI